MFLTTDGARRKTYLPVLRIDPQNLEVHLLAHLDYVFGFVYALIRQFRDMAQALKVVIQFDECAEVGEAGDLAAHGVALLVRGDKALPSIRLKVFDGERKPTVLRVDARDDGLYLCPFFNSSLGCLMRFDQECPRRGPGPSTPSSTSMKRRSPSGYAPPLDASADLIAILQRLPRLDCTCFMPRLMRRAFGSMLGLRSTVSPG